jgi:hypothetical protein
MKFIFIILVFASIHGCAGIDQELDPKVFYQHAMNVEINGKDFFGVGVAPKAEKYKIKVSGRGRMDFLRITTCHRERTKNRQGSGYSFWYTPTKGLEDSGSCMLHVESYEEKKGRNDWALIDFVTDFEKLDATSMCNGKIAKGTVTICQSRQGLVQRLIFNEPVELSKATKANCKIESKNGKTWTYRMTNRICILAFRDVKTKTKFHRHTNIGYEDVLIPAGE